MPEVLKFEDSPRFFLEFNIEPFREEYIPGSRVLCVERRSGNEVFFQVPTPIAQKMNISELERLKKQVHDWWQDKEKSA
jgi:hypothetical protein